MKILLIDRHYWPDANPHAQILRMIAENLATDGHEVTVYAAQPSYNDIRQAKQPTREQLNGVDIRRLSLLPESKRQRVIWLVNWCYVLFRAWFHAVFVQRYDVIVAASTMPILSAWSLWWIRLFTKTPYIIHSQDIHPEAALCANMVREGWFTRLLCWIDCRSYSAAQTVVAICDDQRDLLIERGVSASRIVVIGNPPLDAAGTKPVELPSLFNENTDDFLILFAGNLGRFQALPHLVDAAHQLQSHRDIKFIFMGEGLAKQDLMKQAGDLLGDTVHFIGFQPVDVALASMQRVDLGVVSLHPGMYRLAFPSKTSMYLGAGCPVLTVVEVQSALVKLVREKDLGYVAADHNGAAVADAVSDAYKNRRDWTASRRASLGLRSKQMFGKQVMLDAWTQLLPPTTVATEARTPYRRAA